MEKKLTDGIRLAIRNIFGQGYEVQSYKIRKGDSRAVPAVTVNPPGAAVCPAIRIDYLLRGMEGGRIAFGDAVNEAVCLYIKICNMGLLAGIITKPDKAEILTRVTYRLVNTERYLTGFADIPYKKLLDLSAVYEVTVSDDGIETARVVVDNEICRRFSVSQEELDEAAAINTEYPGFRILPVDSFLAGIFAGENVGYGGQILTNGKRLGGSVVMMFPYYFSRLAHKLGKDLYVLPSSVNEVVVVPEGRDVSPEALKRALDKINAAQVKPEEMLSGNLYKYQRKQGVLEIV